MELRYSICILVTINIISSLGASDKSMTTKWFIEETSTTRTVHNLTNLIYQYYLICGSQFICEKQNYNFIKYHQPSPNLALCPQCSCAKDCVQNGTCCPDVMFSFPIPVCKDKSIIKSVYLGNDQSHMIVDCHEKSPQQTKEKCYKNFTDAEMMQNPPVTYTKYAFTFRNKHCAECNGIFFNYSNWGIDISCQMVSDFNFLSTYEEIIDKAKESNCNVMYDEDEDTSRYICEEFKELNDWPMAKSECNITGTWLKYDRDIESACNSDYSITDNGFTNVFCLMCNPPPYNVNTISSCNVSGNWAPYESELREACTKQDATPSTMPYKNLFCFLCNRNNTSHFRYQDVNAIVEESIITFSNIYNIRILEHALDYYDSVLESSRLDSHDNVQTLYTNAVSFNRSKLLKLHYATFGTNSYCSAKFPGGFFVNDTCSCDESCLFRNSKPFCCHDLLLDSPTSCLKASISGSKYFSLNFGAVVGCNDYTGDQVILNRCKSANPNDIFGILPVTYNGIVYKNLDCFRCNNPTINISHASVSDWELQFECDSHPHFKYFPSVIGIIEHFRRRNCNIQIVPAREYHVTKMSRIYCNRERVDRCNITGQWSKYDRDIELACETLDLFLPPHHGYKNVYCYICNNPIHPSINNTTSVTCHVSAENQYYGENIITACAEQPEVPGFGLYRNIFCRTCSIVNATIETMLWIPYMPDSSGSRGVQTSVRDMFSVYSSAMSVAAQALEVGSEKNTVYSVATNKVHNLTCFPGKMLVGSHCKPLLKNTENLLYVLSFSLEGYSGFLPQHLLDVMQQKLRSVISSINDSIVFDSIHMSLNKSCDTPFIINSVGVRILVHTTIFIPEKVDRILTERRLVNITREDFYVDNFTYFKTFPSYDAFTIPVILKTLPFASQCHVTYTNPKNYDFEKNFHASVVSDLLLCTHVILESQDFRIDGSYMSLSIGNNNRKFNPLEYMLIGTGARICLDDFRVISEEFLNTDEEMSEISKALGVFELICTVISLICLFMTFVTYCLFPVMRSIPGINNMNLVLVMFCAQLFFIVGYTRTSMPTFCTVIGILIHFFWLTTFTCMNVCSIHMYHVFTGDLMSGRNTNRWKKRIMMYMGYSHGLPVLVIVLNIIVLSSTSVDGGIGYGYTVCFINSTASFYITFFVPVILICISNIFFFTRTALKIKNTPKVESTKEKRNDFVIYIKLFSLTGITWILLVIDTLFTVSVFSFLVVFFTVCQGLFVFVSFVLNKRVLKRYEKLCGRETKNVSRDKSSSQTTQLMLTNSSSV
ncbi:uncharacterized protein [Argopecten irradians]|uniref:uncharacterized protein n=1 Tax=Argopecten irradians TaxID=31199 RepID=UPI00371CBF95